MVRRRILIALAAGAIIPLAAAADTVAVRVYNFNFSAAPAGQPVLDPTIFIGDTIRWNFEAGHHTTTSVNGVAENWNSFFIEPGLFFEHTFTNLGVFHYYCLPHGFDNGDGTAGGMAGTITVVPAPSTAALGLVPLGALARRRRR